MPQIINTNIASLNAQRNLNNSQSANSQALERLSSGLRINSAKDDAAGLSISTRFESQTKGLNQAVRNANDGISLAQTAEGALGSMTEGLQRVRELAVQSANATNSDDDRVALQQEVDALVAEISRTAEETNFNGRNLFDGDFNGTFQIGANAGQTVDVQIGELTAQKLGVGDATGVSAIGTDKAIQNGDLTINGVAIAPSRAGDDTASVENAGASAIAKVAAINEQSDETGVTAQVNTTVASGSEMTATSTSGSVTVNGVDIDISTGGVNLQADRDSVISSINAKSEQTGVVAKDGGDAGGVILEASDGRNITVSFNEADFGDGDGTLSEAEQNAAQAATGLSAGTSYGGFTLVSESGADIDIQGGSGTGTGDIANAGLTAGVYSGREAAVTSLNRNAGIQTVETQGTFTTGDFNISSAQQINATNNTFEINVDGGGYQTLTLDGTNQVDDEDGNTLAAGQYDDAFTLAAQINAAISDESTATYDDNSAFRDADGNALVTASANSDGSITLSSVEEGSDSSVVARTGDGSFTIPSGVTETAGTTGDSAVEVSTYSFIFDGNNTLDLTGGEELAIGADVGGGETSADLALGGTYTSADDFASALNAALDADATVGGTVEARVSDDGLQVQLVASDTSVTAVSFETIADGTEVANNFLANSAQQLSNGNTALVDAQNFFDNIADGEGVLLNVDGIDTGELTITEDLSANGFSATALSDAQGGSTEDQAEYLNNLFSTQTAGSGITATAVGDQIVISSDSGGTVALSDGAGTDVGDGAGLLDAISAEATALVAEADEVISDTAGTAETGDFARVSDGTDGFAKGTFISSDYDGTGTDFETQASPLVIEAGVNDTFNVTIDGGSEQEVTIAAGSYATMSELSDAIDSSFATAAETIEVADFSGAALSDYDFSAGGDELDFDVSLNGGAAYNLTYSTDDSGAADVAEAQDNVISSLQADLDAEFGEGKVTVAFVGDELTFSSDDGDDLSITANETSVGTSGAVTAASADNTPALSSSVAEDGQRLVLTSGTTGASSAVEVENGGFAITGGESSGEQLTSEVSINALGSGDLVINGTAIGAAQTTADTASDTTADTSNAAGSGIATAAAINASTEQTGVTAEVNATSLNGGDTTVAATGDAVNALGSIYINNVETGSIQLTGDADRDRASAIDAINSLSAQTGVTAEDNGESITLTAEDGRNISVAIDNKLAENATNGRDSSDFGSYIGLDANEQGIGEADFSTAANYANTAETTYSTVTLKSAGEISIENGVNGTDQVEALGFRLGSYGGSESGTFLEDVDISTFEGAQSAITAIDNALNQVTSQRAELGALQNRFESTVSNLQITAENLTAANSRIRDADFAAETAELSRTQVLQQAGISILAQANQRPQQVLSLLG